MRWFDSKDFVKREQRDETPSLICQMSSLCLAPSSLKMMYGNTELMLRVQDPRTQIPAAKLSREASVKCIARISSAPKDATSVSSPLCTSGLCTYFLGRVSNPSGFLKERKPKKNTSAGGACAASTSALSTLMMCLEICTGDMLALNIGRRTWQAAKMVFSRIMDGRGEQETGWNR